MILPTRSLTHARKAGTDAHRIYWPERRSITVERSVKFDTGDVLLTPNVPVQIEGGAEPSEPKPNELAPPQASDNDHPSPSTTIEGDHNEEQPKSGQTEQGVVDTSMEDEGQAKRIRKPSEYIQRLQVGEGTASGRNLASKLPRGMRPESAPTLGSDANLEFAMSAIATEVEGLDPTFEEAKERPDWPRWREAIENELKSLKEADTWTLVERPDNANVIGSKCIRKTFET